MYKAMRACFPKREQVSYEAICESLARAKKCWGKARSRDRTKQRSEKGREQMVEKGKFMLGEQRSCMSTWCASFVRLWTGLKVSILPSLTNSTTGS